MPEFLKKKILIIQTGYLSDVILATSLAEKLFEHYPYAQIDFMVRKGTEAVLADHPFIHKLYLRDKRMGRYRNLLRILVQIRKEEYLYVINLQSYLSSGIVTAFSRAAVKIGFDNNPMSKYFNKTFKYDKNDKKHEIERLHVLIKSITDADPAMPHLYPNMMQIEKTARYKKMQYITISPASKWYSKQLPAEKWILLIKELEKNYKIYLLGSPEDKTLCESIRLEAESPRTFNLAGKLSLLESAALMKDAVMNYTNDSAPVHLASAMNAPVTVVYCSTVPAFGFVPLSDDAYIVETGKELSCRPCSMYGRKNCPKKHFECANTITVDGLLFGIKDKLKNADRNKKNT